VPNAPRPPLGIAQVYPLLGYIDIDKIERRIIIIWRGRLMLIDKS